jgi:hypothetical protein
MLEKLENIINKARPPKVITAGCNGSVIQRPKALVEPLDGSKF